MKFDIKKLKKDMNEIAIPIVAISLFIIIINSKFGKITEAAMVNPIWIFILVIIVMVFFYRYVEMAFQKRKRLLKLIDIMIFTTIAVVIAVYIYRMIFWYPNKEPMVYDKNNLLNLVKILYLQLSCQM